MNCPKCFRPNLPGTGLCPACKHQANAQELAYAKQQAIYEEVTCSRNLEWTQNVEGYTFDCLDEAIRLVTQHGIPLFTILASVHRGRALMDSALRMGHLRSERSTWDQGVRYSQFYKDIPGAGFVLLPRIGDFEVYVVGDVYPPTKESVAVWTFRRPTVHKR